ITSVAGAWALVARSTSRPSPSGIRRSVTTRSKTSSARSLAAAVTPSASATRWPRLRSRSASVERAEGSSSTTSRWATSGGLQREEQRHPRAAAGLGVDLDAAPVGGDDTLGDAETEAAAVGLARGEGLEELIEPLGGNAGAGVADGEGDVAVATGHLQREPPAPVHRLHAVERDVPQHLGDLVTVEREARHRWIDRHLDVHAAGARAIVADERAHVLDDLADVAGRPPRLLGPRVAQEVGQDAIEPARLGPQRLHGGRPLVAGEPGLVGEERGRVDGRGQRVAELV